MKGLRSSSAESGEVARDVVEGGVLVVFGRQHVILLAVHRRRHLLKGLALQIRTSKREKSVRCAHTEPGS
jgi:hypothetical protein